MSNKEIPEEVQKLEADLRWTYIYRDQYGKLFQKSEKRIELLNTVSPHFFAFIQRMLWEQMILGVARLTDPYKQGTNKNLSVEILPHLASEYEWTVLDDLKICIDKALQSSRNIRVWRNKLTIHRDLPTVLSEEAKLEKIDLGQIDSTLASIAKAINLIYESLDKPELSWQIVTSHDADELIHNLKLAMIYRDLVESERDPWKETEEWTQSHFHDA